MSGKATIVAGAPMETLIVVILDESGSMDIQKSDVIGGYNSFIDTQIDTTEDTARLILIKFNTTVNVVHSATPLKDVPKLNNSNYTPGGGTALYDAIGQGIRIAEGAAHKDERVLVLIMTDGEENQSKLENSKQIKDMIDSHEKLGHWTFAYIGQNPDGWAKTLGNANSNAVSYDMQAQRQNFDRAAVAVQGFRRQNLRQQCAGLWNVSSSTECQDKK